MMNYQLETDKIISEIDNSGKQPSLLLHSCCGPCSSYVIEYLARHFRITVLYYNPSIAPAAEYEKRKSEQKRLLCEFAEVGIIADFLDCDYCHDEFLSVVCGYENEREGGARCHLCYEQRMRRTAIDAKNGGFDYFTTTLSVSPYKNAEYINNIGYALESEYSVKFLPSDFKKRNGYKRSIELSKEHSLYRQSYCGCEFSIPKSSDE